MLIFIFYQTVLFVAVEKENIEIIKILLSNKNINVNFPYLYALNEILNRFLVSNVISKSF